MTRQDVLLIPPSYILGLDCYQRAAQNRQMVAQKQCIQGYIEIESWLMSHLRNAPLPKWMPTSNLLYHSNRSQHRSSHD